MPKDERKSKKTRKQYAPAEPAIEPTWKDLKDYSLAQYTVEPVRTPTPEFRMC
jgi:hypothetical protein